MACSVFAILDRYGCIDQDALATSFAEHHDFDRGYGPGVNRMLRLIRQEGGDWRTLAVEAWDGLGSWGNGAAMRVAPLGAYFADDVDPVVGAELLRAVAEWTPAGMVRDGIGTAISLLPLTDPRSAAATLGNGHEVSAQDTVPFCLWVVAKHPADYAAAFWATASAGGDIDTTCAIGGGIIAAGVGDEGIPAEWLERCEPLPYWTGVDNGSR